MGGQQGEQVVLLQLRQVRKTFQNTVKLVSGMAEWTSEKQEPEPGTRIRSGSDAV